MLKILGTRLRQGYRTTAFPRDEPRLPDRFRGQPVIDSTRCPDGCQACASICPTNAIGLGSRVRLDLGRCLFCTACSEACPVGAITFTQEYRLATNGRDALLVTTHGVRLATALPRKIRALYGRALRIREVSAGGCNGCEADFNVLGTIGFDLGRFGIQVVASPRHADALVITGPVSRNMEEALRMTYDAVPAPKLVIALGACAISGGPFIDHPEVSNGASAVVPVDLYIPGCPPHPFTILDGILRLLDQR